MKKQFYDGSPSLNKVRNTPYRFVTVQGADGKQRGRSTKVPHADGMFEGEKITAKPAKRPAYRQGGQILICWGVTLFLYLLGMNIEEAVSGTHPYVGSMMGFLMVFILPPLLLIEALGIWLWGALRRQAATAAARHDQFLAAVTAGDFDKVKALLPDIYINDTNSCGETALQLAVLAATDTIHPQQDAAMQIAQLLLQNGACASGCLNAMVNQHELYFEATDQRSPIYSAAVVNATELIPLLSAAGDTISKKALNSARYNCSPSIQQALRQVPTTPSELPEE